MDGWQEERRRKRREEYISAAQELFLERELAGVTIKDILDKVGISRVTLYTYFGSVEELAFEVQMKVIREALEFVEKRPGSTGTAREQLCEMLFHWIDFAKKYPNHFRYMSLFDHQYRNQYPAVHLESRYRNFLANRSAKLVEMIQRGAKDGSIRDDIAPEILAATIGNTVLGMLQRMAVRGHIISREHGVDPDQLVNILFDMVTQYVKPEGNPINSHLLLKQGE